MNRNILSILVATAAATLPSAAALAKSSTTARVMLEDHEFNKDRGAVRSVKLEYQQVLDSTTIVLAPQMSERLTPTGRTREMGGDATIYHNWSPAFSTRTSIGVSADNGIQPGLDLAQDMTMKVGKRTTMTLGARFARWQGSEVEFYTAGLRRYFRGGSVSYTLIRTVPQNDKAFFAHLANFSVQDGKGKSGKTSLWLSYGGSSETRTPQGPSLSRNDAGITLQRTQPLAGRISLIPSVGYSRFVVTNGYISSFNIGLGLSLKLD